MEQYTTGCLYITLTGYILYSVHIPFTPAAKTFSAQAETFSTALVSENNGKMCLHLFYFRTSLRDETMNFLKNLTKSVLKIKLLWMKI